MDEQLLRPANVGSQLSGLIASAVSTDEVQCLKFLRSTMESAAVKKAAIKLDPLGFRFSNLVEFVNLTRIVEETGAGAHNLRRARLEESNTWKWRRKSWVPKANHAGAIRLLAKLYNVESLRIDGSDVYAKHPAFCRTRNCDERNTHAVSQPPERPT